ncbi:uncharacterized protein LOC123550087 isoform X1 [Mercenaria mercenaria]|uniref:uncharacterized protein LOC123550087 isoform X1 n=1 Tax=Mercenaria mercenaria TaxID=6596 RepID=UPI00234E45AF|nr:uncharacterized protein LOC123550087 isoform X1 [Mercenaria mercenaria]
MSILLDPWFQETSNIAQSITRRLKPWKKYQDRAEISLETVKNNIQHMKEAMEKDKMKTVEHESELEEKLELMQHTIEKVMINITKTNDKEGLTTESSMRQFCTTNTTCSDVEDSEC